MVVETTALMAEVPVALRDLVIGHLPRLDDPGTRARGDACIRAGTELEALADAYEYTALRGAQATDSATGTALAEKDRCTVEFTRAQAAVLKDLGHQCHAAADAAERTRHVVYVTAIVLAAQLARDAVLFFYGGGFKALSDRLAAEEVMRAAVTQLVRVTVEQGAAAMTRREALRAAARVIGRTAGIGALVGGGTGVAAQVWDIASGVRETFDGRALLELTAAGALGGVAGAEVARRLAPRVLGRPSAGLTTNKFARLAGHLGGTMVLGSAGGLAGGAVSTIPSLIIHHDEFNDLGEMFAAIRDNMVTGFAGGFVEGAGLALHAHGAGREAPRGFDTEENRKPVSPPDLSALPDRTPPRPKSDGPVTKITDSTTTRPSSPSDATPSDGRPTPVRKHTTDDTVVDSGTGVRRPTDPATPESYGTSRDVTQRTHSDSDTSTRSAAPSRRPEGAEKAASPASHTDTLTRSGEPTAPARSAPADIAPPKAVPAKPVPVDIAPDKPVSTDAGRSTTGRHTDNADAAAASPSSPEPPTTVSADRTGSTAPIATTSQMGMGDAPRSLDADTGPITEPHETSGMAEPGADGDRNGVPDHRTDRDGSADETRDDSELDIDVVGDADDHVPTEWTPSVEVRREVVSRVRDLQKEGMQQVLADPRRAREVIAEMGRRFIEEKVPFNINGARVELPLSRVFHPDQLAYMRYTIERSIASGCVQFKIGESTLNLMLSHPEQVRASLDMSYSDQPPGYEAGWLDDNYVMHAQDGYPRDGGQHAFLQAALQHLNAGWDALDPVWRDIATIKDERSADRAPILDAIPPERRAELDLPAHFVDDGIAPIEGDKSVVSAATNMTSVQQVMRGFLDSLAEHRDAIAGMSWADVQHALIQSPQKLSVMAGVTFTTLGEFTEPRNPPRFAITIDENAKTITSIAITGEAKKARADTRPGFCPGFQSLRPSGEQVESTTRQLESIGNVLDDKPNRSISGSNTLMQVGALLLPLLARDYPDLGLTGPTIIDRAIERRRSESESS
ncbi:hypothetical protein [Nocardia paucivorans]|uniref:hypothetical protein n=1 Tax=Nocardia paucivorans TaxID=114259 RepID=UPI0002DFFAC7|nr:hypothetical protein [Nocardia paucivorans]